MYVGLLFEEEPEPSPKFHDQIGLQPGPMLVEESVNAKVVPAELFFLRKPDVGFTEKLAFGAKQAGVGDGVGLGVGVGALVDVDVGPGVGVAVGAGVGLGVGVGGGVGATPPTGAEAIWAVASAARGTDWPPVKTAINGVMRLNVPSIRTVTVLPMAAAHDGAQVMLTSAAPTVTNESLDSLMARHMTRFVDLLQGAPATNEAGFTAASIAPSRAALDSVIFA
jgi:hypothetical protein